MALVAYPGQLQNAQTGNVDSTNTITRNGAGEVNLRPMVLRIVSTIGATPTVLIKILGSVDGTTFFNVAYSVMSAVPGDWTTANITTTTAKTELYMLLPGQPWNFLKVNMSVNTNVTLTTDLL
jgi:hypothetical protein